LISLDLNILLDPDNNSVTLNTLTQAARVMGEQVRIEFAEEV
jgi:hypothetical protein